MLVDGQNIAQYDHWDLDNYTSEGDAETWYQNHLAGQIAARINQFPGFSAISGGDVFQYGIGTVSDGFDSALASLEITFILISKDDGSPIEANLVYETLNETNVQNSIVYKSLKTMS